MGTTRRSSAKHRKPRASSIHMLPDDVVCHILSFLPTKLSVSTSVLAKRWRFLWAHVSSLEFVHGYHDPEYEFYSIFTDIITNVMLFYNVENMNTFRLDYSAGFNCWGDSRLEKWITAAISHNVKKLDLCLPSGTILPECIFTCKTLVDLLLHFDDVFPMIGAVYLPALRSLRLTSFRSIGEPVLRLISGCQVLEELIISYSNVDCPYISSPTIKRLTLTFNSYSFGFDWSGQIKIDTPALRYLHLEGSIPEIYCDMILASSIQLHIIFDDITVTRGGGLLAFIDNLPNMKFLKLCSGMLKVPDSDFSSLVTKFHNLTKLELGADSRFLSYFLENADNLEVLIIRKYQDECRMEPHKETRCLSSHLRTVTIGQFNCTEHEYELIRYLLLNAKVLKRMEIFSKDKVTAFREKYEALKRIALFPRGSAACELAFH